MRNLGTSWLSLIFLVGLMKVWGLDVSRISRRFGGVDWTSSSWESMVVVWFVGEGWC